MATTPLSEVDRRGGKNLKCSVCQDTFRSPRLLPCFHTFCLYCVEGLARTHGGRSFPCPECRTATAVPPKGALGFQVNFYIDEDDLEKERKGPGMVMCPTHPEELVYFCKKCDQAICNRCWVTKHKDHGETQDLCEAAAESEGYLDQCKDRLETAIDMVSKKAVLAQNSLRSAKQKGDALKDQVRIQQDLLLAMVESSKQSVLKRLDSTNAAMVTGLTQAAQDIQQEYDDLLQLRQSLHHTLTPGASHVDKVRMKKEMSEGKGSEQQLSRVQENLPAITCRPALHFDTYHISTGDIERVLGHPFTVSMTMTDSSETIISVFQYTNKKGSKGPKEVQEVYQVAPDNYCVTIRKGFGDTDFVHVVINEKGARRRVQQMKERRLYKRCADESSLNDRGNITMLYSKSYGTEMFQVQHTPGEKTCINRVNTTTENPLETSDTFIQETNLAEPAAFDATPTEDLFVLIEIHHDQQSPESARAKREVCLYRSNENKPFATYKSQEPNFSPSDVCFWRGNDTLLVADRQNDCVHVVSIHDDHVEFERYLAAGDSNLVRPTALNVDDKGRVWIGCENGQVLRCEAISEVESQATESKGQAEGCSADTENGSIEGDGESTSMEESSVSSLALAVENSSRSSHSENSDGSCGSTREQHNLKRKRQCGSSGQKRKKSENSP